MDRIANELKQRSTLIGTHITTKLESLLILSQIVYRIETIACGYLGTCIPMFGLSETCQRLIELAREDTPGRKDERDQEIALQLMRLKHINRMIFSASEAKRAELEQQKESIDKGNLVLENLRYQQTHLKREIKQCKDTLFPQLSKLESVLETTLIPSVFCDDLQTKKEAAKALMNEEYHERLSAQQTLNQISSDHAEATQTLTKKRKIVDELPYSLSSTLEPSLSSIRKRLQQGID